MAVCACDGYKVHATGWPFPAIATTPSPPTRPHSVDLLQHPPSHGWALFTNTRQSTHNNGNEDQRVGGESKRVTGPGSLTQCGDDVCLLWRAATVCWRAGFSGVGQSAHRGGCDAGMHCRFVSNASPLHRSPPPSTRI